MNEQMQVWAHEILIALIAADKGSLNYDADGIAGHAWEIAEAMQAQAEQRRAPEPDLDTNT